MLTPLRPRTARTPVELYHPKWESLSWNVSGFGIHDQALLHVLNTCASIPVRRPFDAVHGSPLCAWNGGRFGSTNILDIIDFRNLVNQYNSVGVSVYLTMTKYKITDTELDDVWCWSMVKALTEHDYPLVNGIIVSNEALRARIRAQYPTLKLLSSILLPTFEAQHTTIDATWYNTQMDWADTVILHPDHAFDDTLLRGIKDPTRVEILANEPCSFRCPRRPSHYLAFDKVTTAGTDPIPHKLLNQILDECSKQKDIADFNNTCMLMPEDIDRLLAMGFTHFKLQGRSMPTEGMIGDISRYIFNPFGPFHALMQGHSTCI